jgi:hypothetical protein
MRVGTKSILFGVHCWCIHPWFVAVAWWRLYGFPWDPRLWVAFFVHDLGYWGKPNMDGPEGETHVELGARIMNQLFDGGISLTEYTQDDVSGSEGWIPVVFAGDRWYYRERRLGKWHDLCLYHSRFYAKRDGRPFSRLCVADKLAIVLTPAWLYLPMARLSGELAEYMAKCDPANGQKYQTMSVYHSDPWQWFANVKSYLRAWVEMHKDGRADTWTPAPKKG